jgi:hypothetical protein
MKAWQRRGRLRHHRGQRACRLPGPAGLPAWSGDADDQVHQHLRRPYRLLDLGLVEGFYGLPFERFERYCPYGTADGVAAFLAPYVAAACTEFNLIPEAPGLDDAVAGVAAVRTLLTGTPVA